MVSLSHTIFIPVVNAILALASLLRDEAAPGMVAVFFALALGLCLFLFMRKMRRRIRALQKLTAILKKSADENPLGLGDEIRKKFSEKKAEESAVLRAWEGYRDSRIQDKENGEEVWRDISRPQNYFNTHDLHFGLGWWRAVPSLFVSVGLFCTFLGLIAALQSMGQSLSGSGGSDAAMQVLLSVASAKFIMSLAGLFCSIIFTLAIQRQGAALGKALGRLNVEIEAKAKLTGMESLLMRQNHILLESRDHFKNVATELIADLGRPLREEIPQTIAKAITDTMQPVIDKVGGAGTNAVDGMVKTLSEQLSGGVEQALSAAAKAISAAGTDIRGAGDKIELLAERLSGRMEESSGAMSRAMEDAIGRLGAAAEAMQENMRAAAEKTGDALNQSGGRLLESMTGLLEGIRDNTAAGAEAMKQAGESMAQAGGSVRDALSAAAEKSTRAVAAETAQTIRAAEEVLLNPLEKIADKIHNSVKLIEEHGAVLGRASAAVSGGAQAAERASASFGVSSKALTDAAAPVRQQTEHIERAVAALRETSQNQMAAMADAAVATSKNIADVLASAKELLGGERNAVDATLKNLQAVLDSLDKQGYEVKDLNLRLGEAFERYRIETEAAVGNLSSHVRDMQKELAPALDTMRNIVSAAENYIPKQPRPAQVN